MIVNTREIYLLNLK